MDHNAQQLLRHLCKAYDDLSCQLRTSPFPTFSTTIKSEYGYCLVKCSMGSECFTIVSVNFAESVRGQGVLKGFLHYIHCNPYQYQGIEVATIQNQGLAARLLSRGWQYKSLFTRWFCAKTPTLIHNF
ncbi:hypothetical protein [Vibrio sp. SCSIO 43136]|uniref:hypothetical protein n=1 Tax=Vibrio sp. SCSIO 43136 TaxID=2819101 RepID=UPI0020763319|nr:hypothetical protein [Vibrio sp. SCSIO 43136]USD67592.1 hypothetical protein J4N39_15470 [Vibrio sp. SCSIO 43136]